MPHILVTLPVEDRHRTLIEAGMPDGDFHYIYRDFVTLADVEAADIILGNVPPKMLAGVTKLKWLQLNSAGPDAYLHCMPEGVILTNSTGAYGLAISEHLLAMLLMLQKKLHLYYLDQKNHDWTDEGKVTSIEGAHALVVGLGNIGGDFGRKLHALGATVCGITRSGERPVGSEDWLAEIHTMDALDELLPRCEIVALALPGGPATTRLFDARRLSLMKKGAFLLNVGRGTVIDTEALCDALESGHLGGAGVDVTDPEPLPPNHRLWDMPNAIVTPHVSGFYHLPETFERVVRIAAANLARYAKGEPLQNVIDFATGYRKLESAAERLKK